MHVRFRRMQAPRTIGGQGHHRVVACGPTGQVCQSEAPHNSLNALTGASVTSGSHPVCTSFAQTPPVLNTPRRPGQWSRSQSNMARGTPLIAAAGAACAAGGHTTTKATANGITHATTCRVCLLEGLAFGLYGVILADQRT
jgi:hypothetical protein